MKDIKYQPKQHQAKSTKSTSALFIAVVLFCMTFPPAAFAANAQTAIPAKVFELEDGSDYVVGDASPSASTAMGTLSIEGNTVHEGANDSVPVYKIPSGQASLNYVFVPEVLSGGSDEWHLIDDKSKKINGVPLESAMQSGAFILQTSLDGATWVDEVTLTDLFAETANTNGFYDLKDIQLQNGCYYKVLVAYKMERQLEDSKALFFTRHHYEYKQIVEEYVFYAYCETDETAFDATPRRELGRKINTGKDNGYSGHEQIDKDDPHYGWDIGSFYVNGYTRETDDANQRPVFLKNVGDRVTLWFHLSEDINRLRGNEKLTVSTDKNGHDQAFEIEQTNFEHGALIIRYTNPQGEPDAPVIYTDYLAANAIVGADTKVQLFEEGDYEVSLNYEIKSVVLIFSKNEEKGEEKKRDK